MLSALTQTLGTRLTSECLRFLTSDVVRVLNVRMPCGAARGSADSGFLQKLGPFLLGVTPGTELHSGNEGQALLAGEW